MTTAAAAVVGQEGIEPSAFGLRVRCSALLSYWPVNCSRAPRTGVEPAISGLKGRRPSRLDHRGGWLSERDSNPHPRINSPVSCRLDDPTSWWERRDSNPCLRVQGPASCRLDHAPKRWTEGRDSNPHLRDQNPASCR